MRAVCLNSKHSQQRWIRLPERVIFWVYSILTAIHFTPCYIWVHTTAPHKTTFLTAIHNTWKCSYGVSNTGLNMCLIHCTSLPKDQMHYILRYLNSYLLAFSWLSFHITLLLLCSVMLIIFSCWTVWLNITMTLSSLPQRGVGADIGAAISSLITCLFTFLFCTGECHFILRFQSGFRLCEYGTDCSPLTPPSACLKPQILPTPHPTPHPTPATLFLQPPPNPSLASSVLMPLFRSQARRLSVCVSEVTLLYGEF